MSMDRAAALRNAEKLLRQGKLDRAIAEYARIAEAQPHDWHVANALGDLYVRAGQVDRGVDCFVRAADDLAGGGLPRQALVLYRKALTLKPDHAHARTRASRIDSGAGVSSDPRVLLTTAERQLRASLIDEGVALLKQALIEDTGRQQEVAALAWALAPELPHAGFAVVRLLAEMAIARGDWGAAAAELEEFVARAPSHIEALSALIDVCVDGRLDATMHEAQGQLVDAYLAVGRAAEARVIAEDLVAREPWDRANIERFRSSLRLLGVQDPDDVIAKRLSGESPFVSTDRSLRGDELRVREVHLPQGASAGAVETAAAEKAGAPAGGGPDDEYARAIALQEGGRIDEAMAALAAASRTPRLRFQAASRLGRIHRERGRFTEAVEWLERAAEAPPPIADEWHAVLYELAEALESANEPARALAICLELQADAGDYRDVSARVARLANSQARG
jgi:tetratricopeptide (TPR) repeat protein